MIRSDETLDRTGIFVKTIFRILKIATMSKSLGTHRDAVNKFKPEQFNPEPWYPGRHVQLYEPIVLLQYALMSHVELAFVHSSTSGKKVKV